MLTHSSKSNPKNINRNFRRLDKTNGVMSITKILIEKIRRIANHVYPNHLWKFKIASRITLTTVRMFYFSIKIRNACLIEKLINKTIYFVSKRTILTQEWSFMRALDHNDSLNTEKLQSTNFSLNKLSIGFKIQ